MWWSGKSIWCWDIDRKHHLNIKFFCCNTDSQKKLSLMLSYDLDLKSCLETILRLKAKNHCSSNRCHPVSTSIIVWTHSSSYKLIIISHFTQKYFYFDLAAYHFQWFLLAFVCHGFKKRINATDNADMTFTVLLFIRLTVFFWKNKTIQRISFVVRLFWQLCNSGIFKDHQYWRHSLQSYSFFFSFFHL